MNGVKWYPKLTHSDDHKALLDHDFFEAKTLIIMNEINHCYSKFRTFREFAHFFKNIHDVNNWCFHEVVPGYLPQKPYFDIDVTDVTQKENVENAIDQLIIIIKNLLPQIKDNDILVFNSNGENKISYHLIIDRWCFLDYRNNKAFSEKVINLLPENFRSFFDMGLYTSVHNFRVFNNHKVGNSRLKIIDKKTTWIYPIKAKFTEFEIFMNILGGSLISNSSYCNLLPNFYIPDNKRYNVYDITLSDDEIDIILDKCREFEKTNILPYKVKHIKGLLIELERTAPSFCKICQRTHESQHPFITLSLYNGDIKWYCRRSIKDEGIYVGNIIKVQENYETVNIFLTENEECGKRDDYDNTLSLKESISSSNTSSKSTKEPNCEDMIKYSFSTKINSMYIEEEIKLKKIRSKQSLDYENPIANVNNTKNKTKEIDYDHFMKSISI
jgi:hypothetical protein